MEEENINVEEISEEKEETNKKSEHPKKEHKKISKEKDELIKANLELKEKVLRITAEFQNLKRRSELDLANAYKYDGIDLVEKILPIIDNFERALAIKQEGTEKFLSGFKMIYDNLITILKEKGIVEIEALNQEFDPSKMQAVLTEKNNEKEPNTVIEVLQKGYIYQDKIIRPAMVKVNEKESEE